MARCDDFAGDPGKAFKKDGICQERRAMCGEIMGAGLTQRREGASVFQGEVLFCLCIVLINLLLSQDYHGH